MGKYALGKILMPLLECINLQNKVNNELKWLQPQSLKPEGVAEIPENNLPEFSLILLEGRENACHKNSNPRQLPTWH